MQTRPVKLVIAEKRRVRVRPCGCFDLTVGHLAEPLPVGAALYLPGVICLMALRECFWIWGSLILPRSSV